MSFFSPSISKTYQIKEGAKIDDMHNLKKEELQQRLKDAEIRFEESDVVARLQALLAMRNLGILKPRETADEDLVDQISDWCKMLARDQILLLRREGLNVEGNKWDHVETLIRAELDTREEDMRPMTLTERPRQGSGTALNPAAVNLLLVSIYEEVRKYNDTALLPGCPVVDGGQLLSYMNNMQHFKNTEDLTSALRTSETDNGGLLSWICSTYGGEIVPARGELLLPGLPRSTRQFILVKQTPALRARFDEAKAAAATSCALFHGTKLSNLRSIIFNGFFPASDVRFGLGLFMAENPNISYQYAHPGYGYNPSWGGPDFGNRGVVLGCEVAGPGRPIDGDGVHVIRRLSSVIIRYIFLVEFDKQDYNADSIFPDGPGFRNKMLAAFPKIDAMCST